MKKVIVIVVLLGGMINFAQKRKADFRADKKELFTLKQKAVLKAKKMTLDLDLTDSQQQELVKIFSVDEMKKEVARKDIKSKNRTEDKENTPDLFALKNRNLDSKIELNRKLKEILSEEQFKKWKLISSHKKKNLHKKIRRFKNREE